MNEENKVVGHHPARRLSQVKLIMKGYQNVKTDQGVIRTRVRSPLTSTLKTGEDRSRKQKKEKYGTVT